MYKRIRYGGIKGKPSNYSEFIIDNEEDLSLIPIENDECSIGSLAYSTKKVFILYPGGWFEFNNDIKNIANKYYENILTKYVLRDFDEELVIDSETIGHYAGAPIKRVIAENALNMIDSAFYMCTSLTDINIPNVINIGTGAFIECANLKNINMPNVINIGDNAFGYCTSLESIDLPSATSLAATVFNNCGKLKHINASAIKSIAATSLKNIPSLESIYLKSCTTIAANSFSGNTNLTDIYLPNAQNTYTNAPWGAVNATIHYECEFNEDGILLELIEDEGE